LPSFWRAAALAPALAVVTIPFVPKVGSRLPAPAINNVGKAKAAAQTSSERRFKKATQFMKFFL